MKSRYLKHIDLTEVFTNLPLVSQGQLGDLEFQCIPKQFAEDVMWRIEWFAEHSVPGLLLRPPMERPQPVLYRTNFPLFEGEYSAVQWDSTLAYTGGEHAAYYFACDLDDQLDNVWEMLRYALSESDESSRSASSQHCSNLQIYQAIRDFFPYTEELDLHDKITITALLIYQYDTLFGLLKDGMTEDALYVVEDIALLRVLIELIFSARTNLLYQQAVKSEDARRIAKLRHAETNNQKAKALSEWDLHGANVSSLAAFARARHKEFGVTERTLYTWVREHRKSKNQ